MIFFISKIIFLISSDDLNSINTEFLFDRLFIILCFVPSEPLNSFMKLNVSLNSSFMVVTKFVELFNKLLLKFLLN